MDPNHPLLANFDDPPPFPSSYPQLRRLDRSVLCSICKEPFTGPVSIACGHSFCSQCIRSWLDSNKVCPTCNEPASEGGVRRNRALEEITEAWDSSRPTLINLTTTKPKRRPPPEPSFKPNSSDSLKRLREGSQSRSQSPAKRTRDGQVIELPSSDDAEAAEDEEEIHELAEDDEGECPLCQAKMSIGDIPRHIERGCPPVKPQSKSAATASGNQKSDWKKVFAGAGGNKAKEVEMKRITKPNYKLTSPADLRALLKEHGLPTHGDKDAIIARTQDWILLYNSNLDTSQPRSLASLRARLAETEAARKRDVDKGRVEAVEELKTVEGRSKYATDKRSEFDRLKQEIMERDKKRKAEVKGVGIESAIEVD